MKSYDLIVIGSGPGGYSSAATAAMYGLKTAVIEKEYFGGVCLNVGCIPTKALLKGAKVYGYMKHARDFGVEITGKPKLNWDLMQKRKKKIVSKLTSGVEALLKGNKVEIIKGTGEVISKNQVKVGKETYEAKNIIIATGSSPIMLPLPGFEEAKKKGTLITSTEALKLPKIPKSIIIVGGGVIGVEFAGLFAELGSKVTILQGMPTILEMLDNDISKEMTRVLKSKGVEIITDAVVKGMDKKNVVFERNGKEEKLQADYTLLSVGRRPNLDATKNINLELTQRKQYKINEYMQTSIPNIYAIGDCSSPLMLAHVAYRQGDIVIAHIKNLNRGHFDIEKMPWCIYLYPEAAGVGLTEQEAKKLGKDYLKTTIPMKHLGKAMADGDDTYGFLKMIVDKEYGEIIGCHIIGATASDMIAEIVVAMKLESTIFDLASSTHPHPTMSEIMYEASKKIAYDLDKKRVLHNS